MFLESAKAIYYATQQLFKSWRTMAWIAAIYTALLATIYFFVSTREATVTQLAISLSLAIAAPILFFMLQSASAAYTLNDKTSTVLKKSLGDFWKLIIVSLPVIALTLLAIYLLNRVQAHLSPLAASTQSQLSLGGQAFRQPWGLTVLNTIKYLLVGVVAPLMLIQLWIAVSKHGLRLLFNRLREVGAGTFAPESFMIYIAGFVAFAVIPYLALFKPISSQRAWLEISLLTLRLLVGALLLLLGWVTTVGALSISTRTPAEGPQAGER